MATDLVALRASLIAREQVKVPGGEGFAVAGLSLPAIIDLCRRQFDDMRTLFDTLIASVGGNETLSLDNANAISGNLLELAPRVAGEIIAVAAGFEPAAGEVFTDLPVSVQLDALQKIADLTFTEEMPPKKVLETVVRHLAALVNPLAANLGRQA